ncbi:MAG TPA: methyltransferase domain-containing protein [Burkholderiales bacterium]|nr:methyltransferase domain-containing protein [Burkholderiales bacterium]
MRSLRLAAALVLLCGLPAGAADREREPDVIYVPTPQSVVEDMLRLADVKKGDVLYDLGCGDGRIPVTAARKYGVRAVGIDIDPERIREANRNAKKSGVTRLVRFRQQDLFQTDLREATVVTLYLLPDLNLKLRPRLLEQLKPGTRVVSHQFDMGDWKPDKTLETGGATVYLWTVPPRKAARS